MNFSTALQAIKSGQSLYRTGWNRSNMFVRLKQAVGGVDGFISEHFQIWTGSAWVPWTPSHADLFV